MRAFSPLHAACIEPVDEDKALAAFTCCFLPRMARWQFPAPEGGASVIVQYPFVVEPAPAEEAPPNHGSEG